MKSFTHHALILGGLYFVVSLLFSLANGNFGMVDVAAFVVFFALFIVLCFKRKYNNGKYNRKNIYRHFADNLQSIVMPLGISSFFLCHASEVLKTPRIRHLFSNVRQTP